MKKKNKNENIDRNATTFYAFPYITHDVFH